MEIPTPPNHLHIAAIDCDFLTYRACAAAEMEIDLGADTILVQSSFAEVCKILKNDFERISRWLEDHFSYDHVIYLFFSHHTNFRKCVDPDYKGHRNRKKPCGYVRAINFLATKYPTFIMDALEADDAMGIFSTASEIPVMICSPDKDMRQIPGLLWNMDYQVDGPDLITPEEGFRWFLTQTLTGDQTDGYAGVPGIGKVKADQLLDKHGVSWDTVEAAFTKAGFTQDDALRNARLARILTANDYDFAARRPKLWAPEEGSGSGASGLLRGGRGPGPEAISRGDGPIPDPWFLPTVAHTGFRVDDGTAVHVSQPEKTTRKRRVQKRKSADR